MNRQGIAGKGDVAEVAPVLRHGRNEDEIPDGPAGVRREGD